MHFISVLTFSLLTACDCFRVHDPLAKKFSHGQPEIPIMDSLPTIQEALDRMESCGSTTPWTAMKEIAGEKDTNLGKHIAKQVKQRIDSNGRDIDQGREGFCGPVALENIFVLVQPQLFANVMADLFCDGGTNRGTEPVKANEDILNCRTSSKEEGQELFQLQNATNGNIPMADWIWAATISKHFNDWYSVCGNLAGEAQSPKQVYRMARALFPTSNVELIGGVERHVWRSIKSLGFLKIERHVDQSEWETVLATVQDGGQAILSIPSKGGAEPLTGSTNHWVTFTKVLDETSFPQLPCATRILKETKACVIWTWGRYYVFESCDNLRQMVADVIHVNFTKTSKLLFEASIDNRKVWPRALTRLIREKTGRAGVRFDEKLLFLTDARGAAVSRDHELLDEQFPVHVEYRRRLHTRGPPDFRPDSTNNGDLGLMIEILWQERQENRTLWHPEEDETSWRARSYRYLQKGHVSRDNYYVVRNVLLHRDEAIPNTTYPECP